jgi:DNA (cytosine-5)-methyltransferase 1
MSTTWTIGALFSGIGGLELGLERAGVGRTLWQCEFAEYPRRVLAKHWPNAHRYTDVRTMGVSEDVPYVDVICGGFPCQDISTAGKQAGLFGGTRSGLFFELMRIVRLVRPRYVVLENVTALLSVDGGLAMGAVVGALAESGYDAQWDCVPAAAVGAPHRRDRVFIVAYSGSPRWQPSQREQSRSRTMARGRPWEPHRQAWATEPNVGRVADGVPCRVDRLKALGNAVVPQVGEVVGGWIMAHADGLNP